MGVRNKERGAENPMSGHTHKVYRDGREIGKADSFEHNSRQMWRPYVYRPYPAGDLPLPAKDTRVDAELMIRKWVDE